MNKTLQIPELKLNSFQIFDDSSKYITTSRMYLGFYNKVPNLKYIRKINGFKFKKWFEAQDIFHINSYFCKERYDWDKKKMENINIMYHLDNEIIVDLDDDIVSVAFSYDQEAIAQSIIRHAIKFKKRETIKHDINLVVSRIDGLDTTSIKLSKPKLAVSKQYNDDLSIKHTSLLKCLNKKDKSGLMLFYGTPGTGKSTYIRYLIHHIKKDVIFISPSMAANLDSPGLTKVLIDNPNSVLVIEDAEQLIISREKESNSSISMLLNLTDGILGDSLGIQVIATFNTHISNIDKALLRKGRLNASYEFKPLSIEKSKKLLEENGVTNYLVNKPMTLAEIYNISQEDFQYSTERQSIGFFNKAV